MNVRWDAVVSGYSFAPPRRVAEVKAAAPDVVLADGPLEVRVRLFGMLVGPGVANPIVLQFARGCALRDVLEELGRRMGRDFLRTLVGENGELVNACRLFVNGEPVQHTARVIAGGSKAAAVEVILLREIEGG